MVRLHSGRCTSQLANPAAVVRIHPIPRKLELTLGLRALGLRATTTPAGRLGRRSIEDRALRHLPHCFGTMPLCILFTVETFTFSGNLLQCHQL
jgi:hypothetical protein